MISVQIVTLFGMIVTSGRESSHFRETSGPQEARHTYRVVGSQWCCTEIDGKPFAPDRNGAVLRQIQISAQSVVLVTDVSLVIVPRSMEAALFTVALSFASSASTLYTWTLGPFEVLKFVKRRMRSSFSRP